MKHLIRAELHKTYDTRTAKVMVALVFFSACLMIGLTIGTERYYAETQPAIAHQLYTSLTGGMGKILETTAYTPITFLGIALLFLICQEWHHNLAQITYVITPRRCKVVAAKLCATLIFFIAAIALFTLFCLLVGVIISKIYEIDYSKVVHFDQLYGWMIVRLSLNIALAMAMAYCIKNQTWALLLYLFLPFVTVLLVKLPFIDKIGSWITLGQVPSLLNGGFTLHQEWYHLLVSVAIWIIIPLGIGIVRSIKEDI